MHCKEVEVRCNYSAVSLIRRELDRSKFINIHFLGDNDDAARVLGCRTLNADDVPCHESKMSLCKGFALLLTDLAAYTISVLILVSTDRTCLKCMCTAEKHAYISMSSRLVFA